MPYTNDYYSRVGDGWYAEKANAMETVVGQLQMKPSVQIPQRSASGVWNPSTTFKCNWADVLFSGTSTAGISGSEIDFTDTETATITVKAILAGIDKWSKLSWQTSGSGELMCTVNGNAISNGQDLTPFNLTDPTITIVFAAQGTVNLTSLTPEIMLTKYDENSIMIEESNINGLETDLDHIGSRINARVATVRNPPDDDQAQFTLAGGATVEFSLASYAPTNWLSFIPTFTSSGSTYLILSTARRSGNPSVLGYNPGSGTRTANFYVDWFYLVDDD